MAKKRNLVVVIILSLITFGIYPIVLFANVTNESNAVAKSDKTAGGFLAIVFMILTGGIYGWYWAFKLGKKLNTVTSTLAPILYLVFSVLFGTLIPSIIAVVALNKVADQPAVAEEVAA